MAHIKCEEGETVADSLKRAAKENIDKFCEEHHGKFIGCGVTKTVMKLCPDIAEFLWTECDMIVMAFDVKTMMPSYSYCEEDPHADGCCMIEVGVDEQADSAVRKVIRHFGPQMMPMLSVGFRNKVEVTAGGKINLVQSLETYRKTVSEQTWQCIQYFSKHLRERHVKVAFFSATPQGGGVALMRHALIRFLKLLGVEADWYVHYLAVCIRCF